MPQATGLVAELHKAFGELDVSLIDGSKGIFDVVVDGVLLYSKHREGGFPRYGDIPKRIKARA